MALAYIYVQSESYKFIISEWGRSFIVSTIAPVPLAAASYASVVVAKKETWRRREIQNRMKELHALTGIPVKSQIVCVIIGDMMQAIKANHELLKSGFYCVAVGPPAVAPNTARLRLTLTAVHTSEDIKRLVAIISKYVKFQVPSSSDCSDYISPRL
ncbi:8-amino-7-oxononanoate synthase-like [Hibiscus syriacus]|uniref:8-amino-7-oxononanoate synthase-like n=1 Tax=Hibiscus syriacus TaxID=106335 RepID=UPI0019215034|nr:8-amino-7-oxononanoate synthase-like [Hibiscus syriacus]